MMSEGSGVQGVRLGVKRVRRASCSLSMGQSLTRLLQELSLAPPREGGRERSHTNEREHSVLPLHI